MNKPSVESPHKFLTLDALRGVAAIIVVEFHFAGSAIVTHGYLAVDFFFLLSGFVLALAYQKRLDAGWSTAAFLKVRLIRLYPLYILGTVLGLVMAIAMAKFGPPLHTLRSYFVLAVLSMLMLPKWIRVPGTLGVAYPLDFPAWSLIIEIFANVFHGLVLRRRSDRFLWGVVIVSAFLFLGAVRVTGDAGFGASARQIPLACTRILFSYTLGMLLFRYWQRGKFRFRIPFVLSPVLLTLALMTPWCDGHVQRYDLLVIFFFSPLLLMASASLPPPASLKKVSKLLGRTSYAIYVLHIPFRDVEELVARHLGRTTIFRSNVETQLFLLVGAVALALLADWYYDEPVRAFLRSRFIESRKVNPIPAMR